MQFRRFASLALAGAAIALAAGPFTKPSFDTAGLMKRPEGYRRWIFLGANYGMGYTEGETVDTQKPKPSTFHNIYVQPAAYDHFARTGEYPDGAMLVMEIVKPGTHASINKQGVFQHQVVGIEVGVKDSKRFAEKWRYYKFFTSEGKVLDTAKAFPKEACWNCHNLHGAADNTFSQFYPAAREVRPEVAKALETVKSAH
ncbi:MAG: cytochrome P460 family protein [Bryobacterales bacterium]|nr:cytochrome P460 family protein [Bryobacterales bacterium]